MTMAWYAQLVPPYTQDKSRSLGLDSAADGRNSSPFA